MSSSGADTTESVLLRATPARICEAFLDGIFYTFRCDMAPGTVPARATGQEIAAVSHTTLHPGYIKIRNSTPGMAVTHMKSHAPASRPQTFTLASEHPSGINTENMNCRLTFPLSTAIPPVRYLPALSAPKTSSSEWPTVFGLLS